jgi:cytochrome c-type biogenesis protein CcmH/NrfG
MRSDSIVFAIAGTLFGFIAGWILGTQQGPTRAGSVAAPVTASAPVTTSAPAAATGMAPAMKPMLDESQVSAMRNVADRDPKNFESRVQLGNLYFDAERYSEAVRWYEEAFALNPADANVSTDLAVSYYYTDQPDRAIAQFERSLKADPRHVKSYLNMGIVKAFGKQDFTGATAAWDQVLKLAPGSQEAQAAQRALDNIKAAHPGGATTPPAGQKPGGN